MIEQQPRGWRVSDLAISYIRTYVPVAAGAVLAWVELHWHLVLPDGFSAQAVPVLTAGVIGGYYWVSRWLERRRGERWHHRAARWLGRWMLGGVIRQPVYPAATSQLLEVQRDGSTRAVR